MNILLVTTQVIEDTGNKYRCTSNLYAIIKRFSYLGDMSICTLPFKNNSHTKIEKELSDVVKYGNVHFIKKDYVWMSSKNKKVIEPYVADSDLVISYSANLDLLKICKRHHVPILTYVVSCAWDAYWNHGFLGKLLAPYKFVKARIAIKDSDYVLYVSNEFLQSRYPTQARFSLGCSDVKITECSDSIMENRINLYKNWEQGKLLNIVTTAAVDVAYKGQEYVIKALYYLKQKGYTNIHYYLLGGGDPLRLERLVKKCNLEENIHFMGIVPHDEVFNVLDSMHIYIQPSLQEGLPRAMVEAMSRGMMCIGAKTAAIPELIDGNYVVRRKSSMDIACKIISINKDVLIEQANKNFLESKKYIDAVLDEKRKAFFNTIIDNLK